MIDKRPFVKFHAAQSIVVFGGLMILRIAVIFMHGIVGYGVIGFGFLGIISLVLGLITLILWILLMVKAYQHQLYRVPIAADIADGLAK